jgi:hypothetical protein
MNVLAVNRLFAVLALASLVLAVSIGVAWMVPAWRRRLLEFFSEIGATPLVLVWLVATTATAGSLYYSEVVGFEPCLLCWWQRIAMYPLVITGGIAALRADPAGPRYVVPPAIAGFGISAYHYWIQVFPDAGGGVCGLGVPCTLRYVEQFGFVSIPFMAGAGFLAIIALSLTWAAARRSRT